MPRSPRISDSPIDPAAAGPPLHELPGHGGLHTVRPRMVPPRRAGDLIDAVATASVREFLRRQQEESLRIRGLLRAEAPALRRMVGGENLVDSFAARIGLSTDSTGLRGLVPEACVVPPDVPSLRALLAWCFRHRVPVVPYGAGSGYNMGVVPLCPSVTVWTACLRHVAVPRPHPSPHGRVTHVVSAEAGAPYAEVVRVAKEHGLALRCVPNSPRASVGGVVATGSNGGRRIGEVVWGGQAVLANGSLVRFATTPDERAFWSRGAFPMIHKFHGAPAPPHELRRMAGANEALPATVFVGSEGTTGFITSVDLELESPAAFACTMGVWLPSTADVPALVRAVRGIGAHPTYFELLTEPAVGRYLRADFPDLFHGGEQAYVILTFEEDDETSLCDMTRRVKEALSPGGRCVACGPYPSDTVPPSAQRLIAPREELPKRLVSKCKTDLEVLLDALPRVIPRLVQSHTCEGDPVESILFGHLSPGASAILHWNIGGVDIADEESSAQGWRHIERALGDVARVDGSRLEAVFTGEHGVAGRPWLFHEIVSRQELARIARVKRALDPLGLLNRNKLVLPTRMAKALRGRVLARAPGAPDPAIDAIRSRCTRCNACQDCPVLNAQVELRTRRPPRRHGKLVMGKRSLIHVLELAASAEFDRADRSRLVEEASLGLQACLACGRCDAACAGSITLEEISSALGRPLARGSWRTDLLHRLFCAPLPRSATMRVTSALQRAAAPLASLSGLPPPVASYVALPPVDGRRYTPHRGVDPRVPEDLAVVGTAGDVVRDGEIVVRFRGCVGTIGQARATESEDRFFRSIGISFLDFVPDLCCGFPFIASGHMDEGRRLRADLLGRIATAAQRLRIRWEFDRVVVMASCPTCQESLRHAQADDPVRFAPITVVDPAELAISAVPRRAEVARTRVALKLPCHATQTAAAAQQALLRSAGFEPEPFEQCCGLAGTGRLDHPEVGMVIARRLTNAILSGGFSRVVSGCPSCRDGLRLQARLDRTGMSVVDIYGLLMETKQDGVER